MLQFSFLYKQGNFFILYGGYGKNRFTLSLGPDWCPLSMILICRRLFVPAWLLCLAFAVYSIYVPQVHTRSFRFQIVYYACTVLMVLFYLYTGICDAGVITRDEDNSIENGDRLEKLSYSYCTICQVYRPPHAAHCSKCGVCFRNLDHHCSFMGYLLLSSHQQAMCRQKQYHFFLLISRLHFSARGSPL